MVRLTEEVGQEVRTTQGVLLGRVRDLSVRAGSTTPAVARVLFGPADRGTVAAPWSSVRRHDGGLVVLDAAVELDPLGPTVAIDVDPDELLLGRDVLDTQAVDVPGRFLVRVADVLLAPVDDDLVVTGIELSSAAKLQKVGLQRLGGRRAQRTVPWADLHLTSLQGRSAQLATTTPLLELGPGELARVLTKLSTAHVHEVFDRLDAPHVAGVLAASGPDQVRRLLDALPDRQVDDVLAALPRSRATTFRRALGEIAAARARAARRA